MISLKFLIAQAVLVFSVLFLLWMLHVAWEAILSARRERRKPDARIACIHLWNSGELVVFNHSGQQIAELEGRYRKIRKHLLARLPDQVVFRWGLWVGARLYPITRREFENWKPGWKPPYLDLQEVIDDSLGYLK